MAFTPFYIAFLNKLCYSHARNNFKRSSVMLFLSIERVSDHHVLYVDENHTTYRWIGPEELAPKTYGCVCIKSKELFDLGKETVHEQNNFLPIIILMLIGEVYEVGELEFHIPHNKTKIIESPMTFH